MTSSKKKRNSPCSLRLPLELYARLKERAHEAGMTLHGYIIFLLWQAVSGEPIRSRRFSPQDRKLLAGILAALGLSGIASNLNQLAKATYSGSLPITPETEAMLRQACAAVLWMRDALMQALGMKTGDGE